jgi:hypothetical protein
MVALCGGFALQLCGSLFTQAIARVPAIVRGS